MNTKFKRIRAKQLLNDCETQSLALKRYVEALKAEDWSKLDSYDYESKLQTVAFSNGQIAAFEFVIAEIGSWCW